jgi:hypothetical protein
MTCEYCERCEAVIIEGCPYRVCDQCWAYLGIAKVNRPSYFTRLFGAVWLFLRIAWREDQTGYRMSVRTAASACWSIWR